MHRFILLASIICVIAMPVQAGEISFVLTGDVIPGSDREPFPPFKKTAVYMPYEGMFSGVKPELKSGDVTIGNLEGPICHSSLEPYGKGPNSYNFRIPVQGAELLKDAGFDVLSIANNHTIDYTVEGLMHTYYYLRDAEIQAAGFYALRKDVPEVPASLEDNPLLITRKGVRIIVLGFASREVFKSINYIEETEEIIALTAEECDILVVTFHGGAEGADAVRVPRKPEVYYNEKRGNVYEFARNAVDAGADIVFGHGPHVLRGMELYKNRIIAYSLGDFCGNGLFNAIFKTDGIKGISCILKLTVNNRGEFIRGSVVPISIKKKGIPRVDPEKRAVKLIKRLSLQDFPKSPLEITPEGALRKKKKGDSR
ncbi:MAG: CapA family protein [bacterium]|nr:CapA family protein [bacterium]